MTIPSSLFLFAGETSGDLHGSYLMRALNQESPFITFWGVGGPEMRREGLQTCIEMEKFEVMGLTDVLLSLPRLLKQLYFLRKEILRQRPDGVILIDYPGFNLRLAKALRRKGYVGKIIQYICPSIWAHSQKRIENMVKTLDLLLTILPFEPKYFLKTSLKVCYVGNPLQEYIKKYAYKEDWKQQYAIPKECRLVALFPGSREGEIKRNLPFILKAAALLKQDYPDVCFILSCAHPTTPTHTLPLLLPLGLSLNKDLFIVSRNHSYELMRDAYCSIAKSGTVTLELALHDCPTLVIYNLTFLNWFYAKYILNLQLPFYALANIVAEKKVFPELIEFGFSTQNIYSQTKFFLENTVNREDCLQGCKHITALLNDNTASQTAAKKIRELFLC